MKSIYSTFTGLFKDGKPIDFHATWKKTLDKASEREVALFQISKPSERLNGVGDSSPIRVAITRK